MKNLQKLLIFPALIVLLSAFNGKHVNYKSEKNILRDTIETDSSGVEAARVESSFPGGNSAWMRYLTRKFYYPRQALKSGIQGTVVVQFIVSKEGDVTDIEAVSGPTAGGLREAVTKIIKRSGKWNPATINGLPVQSYKKQTVTFRLEKY